MERVVYILGAGFSAPLGIPTVRDFLLRAKDLYFGDRGRYSHFAEVLAAIRSLDAVKNYLHADLFDIEEVFSIIEMKRQLGAQAPDIVKFIADVVQGYTPPLPPPKPGGTSISEACGSHKLWTQYAAFAVALARLKAMRAGRYAFDFFAPDIRYDLITLNYDRAVELPLSQIVASSQSLGPGTYHRPSDKQPSSPNVRTTIMKLHGDAAQGTIVPPTWDKSVRSDIMICPPKTRT